ncbi:MAG TPA: SET domain-containing protein-lysine N-methyltransferase [Planctomycetaceae bacterium]|jgi:hypothetical protein
MTPPPFRTAQDSGLLAPPECELLLDNAPKCDVGRSPLHGFGLFCRVPIQNGEGIVDFSDSRVYREVAFADLEDWRIRGTKYQPLGDGRCLVSAVLTKYSVVNHSRTPSAGVDLERRMVIAIRDIAPGEEITTDYRKDPFPDAALPFVEPWL